MFKRNTLGLGGTALCGALLVSGCANQMSQRSEHEERVERKLLDHSLQIDVGCARHHAASLNRTETVTAAVEFERLAEDQHRPE